MSRAVVFDITTDTAHFSPQQLQPRAILALAFNGLARWLREHLVSFPRLISEHHTSVVILSAGITYQAPCRFFDGDGLTGRATLVLRRQATRAELRVELDGPSGRAATARILLCPVHIDEPASLAATPCPFPSQLVERFRPEEIDPASPTRPLLALQAEVARAGTPLAMGRYPFVVHRHLCEVADQWAFFEVPGLIGASREVLALGRASDMPLLRRALGHAAAAPRARAPAALLLVPGRCRRDGGPPAGRPPGPRPPARLRRSRWGPARAGHRDLLTCGPGLPPGAPQGQQMAPGGLRGVDVEPGDPAGLGVGRERNLERSAVALQQVAKGPVDGRQTSWVTSIQPRSTTQALWVSARRRKVRQVRT